jgi:hypothetical protein
MTAIGVCSVTTSGIQPTGMDCHAECTKPTDCCELPPSVLTQFDVSSCADLAALIGSTDCAMNPGAMAAECFAQSIYCQCTKDTWDCTTAGTCVYTAPCTDPGLTTNGCPLRSRSDLPLVASCNTDGRCAVETATATCTKDSECTGKTVADSAPDTCSANECTCYKAEGNCYRKCASDLDCAPGKECNTKTHVCEAPPPCTDGTDDVMCLVKTHNIKSVCAAGVCTTSCATDLDCNSLTGSLTHVCGADHTCQPIGCSADTDCTGSAVHMFCTPVLTGEAGTTVSSAITQGGTG